MQVLNLQKGIENWLVSLKNKGYFPGIAVGVVIGKKLKYVRYIGYSSLNHKYEIASVTKTMTALGVMRLVEKGILDLDKPLSYYLPKVLLEKKELGSKPILLRNLLSHTSGLPDLRYYQPKVWHSPKQTGLKYPTPEQIYPTGLHYRYSNHNFMLLGSVIEVQTKQKLKEYLEKNVFLPLGMQNTIASEDILGAWGIQTTLPDLAKFASFWLERGVSNIGKKVLDVATIQKMFEEQTYIPFASKKRYIGLAWRIQSDSNCVVTFFHIGGAPGVAAWVQLFPAYQAAIVYLANPPNYENNLIGYLVALQKKLGDLAGAMVGAKESIYQFEANKLSENEYSLYVGKFKNPLTGEQIEITTLKNYVYLKTKNNQFKIIPDTTNVFHFPAYEFTFSSKSNQVIGFSDYKGFYGKLKTNKDFVDIYND
ncbi:MAG: beta-lactamase family protein [Leptospiraceae bacterium]|nr:beta-lactamase family protein [Leptospiraceae bacterium]MCP5497416.1 beta-lactamase family protein [Leptospiraceae bacterium]